MSTDNSQKRMGIFLAGLLGKPQGWRLEVIDPKLT